MSTTNNDVRIETVGAGIANVYRGTKRVGSVERLDNGKWVPIDLSREAWATPPQFPRFPTRDAAAEALASGEVVYG